MIWYKIIPPHYFHHNGVPEEDIAASLCTFIMLALLQKYDKTWDSESPALEVEDRTLIRLKK